MGMEHWWNGTDRGKRITGREGRERETYHSDSLSAANRTWADRN